MFKWLKRLFTRKDSPSNKIKIIDGKEYVQTIAIQPVGKHWPSIQTFVDQREASQPRTLHLGEEKHPPKSSSGVPHSPRHSKTEPTSISASTTDLSTPDSSSSSFDGFGGGDSGGGGASSDF